MAKYKNISDSKVVIFTNNKVVSILPGDVIDLPFISEDYSKFLVEVIQETKKLDDLHKEIKDSQASDLPEDCVVIVSDSIVEELKKEKALSTKKHKIRKH